MNRTSKLTLAFGVAAPILLGAAVSGDEAESPYTRLALTGTGTSSQTTEFVSVPGSQRVEDALASVRAIARIGRKEAMYTIYSTDPAGRVVGVMSLRELLAAPDGAIVSDIAWQEVVTVTVHAGREEIVERTSKYDLVAVPVQPSPPDIWAAEGTLKLAAEEKRPACLVLNRVPTGKKLLDTTDQELRRRGLAVLPAVLGNRAAFSHAFADGLGITEFAPRSQAAAELRALLAAILVVIK